MQYYKKVGATYRNPHYPGIRLCLLSWFNRCGCFIVSFFSGWAQTLRVSSWWQTQSSNTATTRLGQIMFFDMACGSLIYYIIYIKSLPEVSWSSCQAGRSCLPSSWLSDSSLTDGYPVEKLPLHLWNGVMSGRSSIMISYRIEIIPSHHPLHRALYHPDEIWSLRLCLVPSSQGRKL